MEPYFTKKITLVCDKLQKTFLIQPSICLGLTGTKRIERVLLPNSTYGEYVFYVQDIPTYYCYALDPTLDGTTLKKWMDEEDGKEYLYNKLVLLLKEAGISGVSAIQCQNRFRFSVGKEYVKEFSLLEIRDIKIEYS